MVCPCSPLSYQKDIAVSMPMTKQIGKPEEPGLWVVVTTRLEVSVVQRLRRVRKQSGRSLASIIDEAVRAWLERWDEKA